MMIKYGRILVVDDDPESRDILKRLLTLSDYEVETVESGRDAVELLKGAEFKLVLTDIVMPEMDGLALLSFVKSRYPDIPVIPVTGRASGKTKKEALEIGVESVLSKPFTRDHLLAIVSEALIKKK
ncbi:MAG: response regulator [Candidatus Anammoxibacter sp.]